MKETLKAIQAFFGRMISFVQDETSVLGTASQVAILTFFVVVLGTIILAILHVIKWVTCIMYVLGFVIAVGIIMYAAKRTNAAK